MTMRVMLMQLVFICQKICIFQHRVGISVSMLFQMGMIFLFLQNIKEDILRYIWFHISLDFKLSFVFGVLQAVRTYT